MKDQRCKQVAETKRCPSPGLSPKRIMEQRNQRRGEGICVGRLDLPRPVVEILFEVCSLRGEGHSKVQRSQASMAGETAPAMS